MKKQTNPQQRQPSFADDARPTRDVKSVVTGKLLKNIKEGRDRATRSIELLGKMKDNDLFVRNDAAVVGIFADWSEEKAARIAALPLADDDPDVPLKPDPPDAPAASEPEEPKTNGER